MLSALEVGRSNPTEGLRIIESRTRPDLVEREKIRFVVRLGSENVDVLPQLLPLLLDPSSRSSALQQVASEWVRRTPAPS